jgi:hypothetical protein
MLCFRRGASRFGHRARPSACAILAVALCILGGSPVSRPARAAATLAALLDGERDASYVLLAEDAARDLPPELSAQPEYAKYAWMDLTRLYATSDASTLYIYADLADYSFLQSSGQLGLAVDTTPDIAADGGLQDPWNVLIAYTYTTALSSAGEGSVVLNPPHHPDKVIRGNIAGPRGFPGDINDGFTALCVWDGNAWQNVAVDWGGLLVPGANRIGEHIAYADWQGVELAVPLSDLGVQPGQAVGLSLYTTSAVLPVSGAADAVPGGEESLAGAQGTALHSLARYYPDAFLFAPAVYTVTESAGTAVITVTLTSVLTETAQVSYFVSGGSAGSGDASPLAGTLTFEPGVTAVPIVLTVAADALAEGTERLDLTLSAPESAGLGQPDTATLWIVDDSLASVFLPMLRR